MKIIHDEGNVVKSYGLQEEHTFKIRTNAHAFKMLSSGLYSDKETAVLREIGCNAYDAHVSVGKANTPFDVKLPNKIDNQFYIRDYGPGLSDEDIKELYTTYFASTKQDSNDFTGAFGLGSKSPFSYTDSFTITSYFGGMCRIYSAHIGTMGNPQIAQMSESESSETGISIGFPVKPQDFETFRMKANEVFRWFKTVPNIIGGDKLKPVVYKIEEPTWALLEDNLYKPHVLMGNVKYPLDWAKLGSMDKLQAKIVNMGNLILKFPIGKVQVAASREELQYDEESSKAVKSELTNVGRYIVSISEKSWLAAKTWKEKCDFREYSTTINQGYHFDEEVYRLGGATDPKGLYEASVRREVIIKNTPSIDKLHIILFKSGRKGYTGQATSGFLHLPFDKDLKVVSGDATNAHKRTKQAIGAGKLTQCVLVYKFLKNKGTDADVQAAVDYIDKQAGGLEHIKLEDLDAPPKVTRLKKGQLPVLPSTLIAATDKLYLPTTKGRYSRVIFNGERSHWDWQRINENIAVVRKIVPIKTPVEITLQEIKKYKVHEQPSWSPFYEHVKEVLEDKASLNILEKAVKSYKPVVNINKGSWIDVNSHNVLQNLVVLKEREKALFDLIEPILKQKSVLDTVEEVHKASLNGVATTTIISTQLNAYKQLLDAVGSKIQHPELKEEDISSKIPNATKITYNDMIVVAKLSKNAFLTMMKEYLN